MEGRGIKTCPECNQPIKGRSDKKFCSDLCRNSYNNKVRSVPFENFSTINRILKKNRKILEKLHTQGIKRVKKERLLQLDFNFYYFTHIQITRKEISYFFCYDCGYCIEKKDYYKLMKQ